MEPGRGRSRPPWRDASGAGDLWRLCQAVYMATIPTWLGGVGGAAIPTSGAVGGCGARRPAAGLFYRKSVPAASPATNTEAVWPWRVARAAAQLQRRIGPMMMLVGALLRRPGVGGRNMMVVLMAVS